MTFYTTTVSRSSVVRNKRTVAKPHLGLKYYGPYPHFHKLLQATAFHLEIATRNGYNFIPIRDSNNKVTLSEIQSDSDSSSTRTELIIILALNKGKWKLYTNINLIMCWSWWQIHPCVFLTLTNTFRFSPISREIGAEQRNVSVGIRSANLSHTNHMIRDANPACVATRAAKTVSLKLH